MARLVRYLQPIIKINNKNKPVITIKIALLGLVQYKKNKKQIFSKIYGFTLFSRLKTLF